MTNHGRVDGRWFRAVGTSCDPCRVRLETTPFSGGVARGYSLTPIEGFSTACVGAVILEHRPRPNPCGLGDEGGIYGRNGTMASRPWRSFRSAAAKLPHFRCAFPTRDTTKGKRGPVRPSLFFSGMLAHLLPFRLTRLRFRRNRSSVSEHQGLLAGWRRASLALRFWAESSIPPPARADESCS